MPVRSLSSSVLKWPDADQVRRSLEAWARAVASEHPEIRHVGYMGSYARGDYGVGSDIDVVLILESCEVPFDRRAAAWDLTGLPVPADLRVYTSAEWQALTRDDSRFSRTVRDETVWML